MDDYLFCAMVAGAVVAYAVFVFIPAMIVRKDSPYRSTVSSLCAISIVIPVLWVVAIVFAVLPTPRQQGK